MGTPGSGLRPFVQKYIEIDGYAGSLGAAFLYDENPGHIDELFRQDYVRKGRESLDEESELPLIEDGVIAEINRLCKEEKCGYELSLRKIPVKQFTIEICEQYQKNPYELACHAAVRLTDEETPASCGCTTQALAKILVR